MSSDKKQTPAVWKDLAAGSVGGLAQTFAGHPLDTVKVRLQTMKVQPGQPAPYTGLVDCVKKIYAAEGMGGLYKGVSSPIAGVSFFNAALFFTFGLTKDIISEGTGKLSYSQYFVAGAVTGGVVSLVECPVDLLKIKLQAQPVVEGVRPQYSGLVDCAQQITKQFGIKGIYQGLGSQLLRNIPANGLYFGAYEMAKDMMTPKGQDPSSTTCFLAGGIGGLAYWFFTYPVETVKSRIQSDHVDPSKRVYKNFIDCFNKTRKTQGVKVLFNGFSACMLRAFPANAACFLAFEQAKKFLN